MERDKELAFLGWIKHMGYKPMMATDWLSTNGDIVTIDDLYVEFVKAGQPYDYIPRSISKGDGGNKVIFEEAEVEGIERRKELKERLLKNNGLKIKEFDGWDGIDTNDQLRKALKKQGYYRENGST